MLPCENPSTRSVPISRERRATAAYIVFIAAKLLPTAMMIETKMPMNSIGAPDAGLQLVVFLLRDGVHAQPLVVVDIVDQRLARVTASVACDQRGTEHFDALQVGG